MRRTASGRSSTAPAGGCASTRPAFESETDAPELGAALCDFAKVCAVMAEPAGWQAAQDEVPVRREGLRVLPEPTEVPPEAGTDVEAITPTGSAGRAASGGRSSLGARPSRGRCVRMPPSP